MKKIILTIFFVYICVCPVFGDEADKRPSNVAASSELKVSASQMSRVGVDSKEAIRLNQAMIEYHFSQQNALSAQKVIMRSYDQGLPVGPVMNKAYEGMAKGIQQENIIRAMNKVMARYGFAYQQAGELTQREVPKKRIMEQIAECVAAGVTDYDARRLVYRLKYSIQEMPKDEADDLAVETFRAVKDMARLNVHSLKASDLALEALTHRYGAREMTRMRQSFMKHARDTWPNTVAEGYFNAIQQGNRLELLDFSDVKDRSPGSGSGAMGTGSAGIHGGGAGSPGRGQGGSKGSR